MHLPHSFYCFYGAFLSTDHASLAVIVVRVGKAIFIHGNAAIRASGNAGHTFGADIVIPDRLKYPPVTGLSQRSVPCRIDSRAGNHGGFEWHINNRTSFENDLGYLYFYWLNGMKTME